MAAEIHPVGVQGSSDPDRGRQFTVEEALRAARVDADAGERLRLGKLLRRLAPDALPGAPGDSLPSEATASFEDVLRGLSRG